MPYFPLQREQSKKSPNVRLKKEMLLDYFSVVLGGDIHFFVFDSLPVASKGTYVIIVMMHLYTCMYVGPWLVNLVSQEEKVAGTLKVGQMSFEFTRRESLKTY